MHLSVSQKKLKKAIDELLSDYESEVAENKRLKKWVDDLQSGMYINCVYCGHRYGPEESTPSSMADILKEHIEQCPKHPMSLLKKAVEEAGYVFGDKEIPEYIFAQADYLETAG